MVTPQTKKKALIGTSIYWRFFVYPRSVVFITALILNVITFTYSGLADPLEEQKITTEAQLQHLRENLELSKDQQNELNTKLEKLKFDQKNIKANLIKTAHTIETLEVQLEENTNKTAQLKVQRKGVKQSLISRRGLLSEVLAALQRMGKKPPPAILIQPKDALSSVRSAILLGAVVPELRAETEILFADLTELKQLQQNIVEQQDAAKETLVSLHQENTTLNALLAEKARQAEQSKSLLDIEIAQSQKLIEETKSLEKLIALIESKIDEANAAALAVQTEDEKRRQKELERLAQSKKALAENANAIFSNTDRIQPAIAFSHTKGLLPFPVNGIQLREFGEKSEFGEISKGIILASRPNSKVISPSDGWIIYAGKFRSYGKVLILKLGSGYHLILAGMEQIHAQIGQFVLRGEPIATMGRSNTRSTLIYNVSSKRPVLYVELRKDDISIDPAPWWDKQFIKRVSNDS
jgi:septal ring factor EnvC (AmiA/AmiB activator)